MTSLALSPRTARRLWLHAQKLDTAAPFGAGPDATRAAVEHLGYVQIDTINVIERCHHHILYSRIPDYHRNDLRHAQSVDKSVFEYWTHALAYMPTRDLPIALAEMRAYEQKPSGWFDGVDPKDLKRLLKRIRDEGALSIRDITDDEPVEKDHPWGSRKPSKRALELAFFIGALTISERQGIVKSYELPDRHFAWDKRPRPASEKQVCAYMLDRALRAQGLVSLDSICHLDAPRKAGVRELIEARVKRKQLRPVHIEGFEKSQHWMVADAIDALPATDPALTHILSPFDPLVILRKRTGMIFGYDHVFEAYIPKDKRRFGYFALPVLVGDEIVAAIDLKTDRQAKKLLVQNWTWVGHGSPAAHQAAIEAELGRFERFQLAP